MCDERVGLTSSNKIILIHNLTVMFKLLLIFAVSNTYDSILDFTWKEHENRYVGHI